MTQPLLNAGDIELGASMVREHLVDYGTSSRKKTVLGYRDFIDLSEKSENRYELIDGVVYQLASPCFSHKKNVADLYLEVSH